MPMCTNPGPRHNDVPPRPSRRSERVMPERADEARCSRTTSGTIPGRRCWPRRRPLWADAGPEAWRRRAGRGTLGTADNRFVFLTAYYRRVAAEDLIAAGPERLAETAARHAALGATRPQGRPAVGVRPAQSAPGQRLPHRREHRRRHRQRRHAVPGRLGDDGAQPARGRHPPDRAPGARRAQGRGGHSARQRRGRRHRADADRSASPGSTSSSARSRTSSGSPPTCAVSSMTCGSRWRTSGGCAAPPESWSSC